MTFDKNDRIVAGIADTFLPLALVYGLSVVLHGNLTPGGGFQGGCVAACAVLLIYLGHGFKLTKKSLSPHALHTSEALGSTAYIALAVLGLIAGLNFCGNLFAKSGKMGELWSGGTVFLMNLTVGWKVFSGIALLIIMMIALLPASEADGGDTEEAAE